MEHDQKLTAPPHDAVFAYYPVEDLRREEEIRLVDLWLVLVRRKAVFFTVAGLILAAGLAYALLAPPKYRYSALIELGSVSTADGGLRTVEGVSTALAKVNDAFLPAALADYLKTQPEDTEPPEVRASNPKGSETIMLSAEGPEDEGAMLMALEAAVIARLAQDHATFLNAERRAIRSDITAASNEIAKLSTYIKSQHNKAKRTAELVDTLHKRRNEFAGYLNDAITLEQTLRTADVASRDAAALLQANVESRELRDQLLEIDERLTINLPQQMDTVRADIESAEREIAAQRERVANLESRLADVRDTRAIQSPSRSVKEIGPGKVVITLAAGILAIFLGIIMAFIAEQVAKLRSQLHEIAPDQSPGSL